MKSEILQVLRETDGFVSGQNICRKLAVTRTAVWKAIGQLREEGYVIEAVPNKGYRLKSSPDSISAAEIGSRLTTRWAGLPTVFLKKIDSTNNEAKRRAESGAVHGTLFVAEEQDAGKGRRGRSWDSPVGSAIAMTLLLKPWFSPGSASMLTLVAAMAVADGIRAVTGLETGIKWPNDIVINGKKVCGILTEMSAEMDCINYVVIGIGINVNITEFPEEIKDRATSLLLETGERVCRAEIIAQTMSAFERYYELFLETEDLTLLKPAYEERLVNLGKPVCVLDPKGEWKGVAQGIDEKGRLLVKAETDGAVQAVESGEVSVRGIYGYV